MKRIVDYHYGFVPAEDDLLWIDQMLRNQYIVLHDQRIIREVVATELGKGLSRYRDRLGNLDFEGIWLEKSAFKYLTLATMCYRMGISAGGISLCRAAIEAGLREGLAEELAKREAAGQNDLPEKTLAELCRLRDEGLAALIGVASKAGIPSERLIEESASALKFQSQSGRKILDKFIRGDIVWMVDSVGSRA